MNLAICILLTVTLAGCSISSRTAQAPSFPAAYQVDRLVLRNPQRASRVPQVDELLGRLGELNTGWHYVWDTYPSPQTSIDLVDSSGKVICRVDIGLNWIGSTCGHDQQDWPPLVTLSETQARAFKEMVHGTWAKSG